MANNLQRHRTPLTIFSNISHLCLSASMLCSFSVLFFLMFNVLVFTVSEYYLHWHLHFNLEFSVLMSLWGFGESSYPPLQRRVRCSPSHRATCIRTSRTRRPF